MPSVETREFVDPEKLERLLSAHQNKTGRFGDPLKILLAYEAEAEEIFNERAQPTSRSVFIRNYINLKLHSFTR